MSTTDAQTITVLIADDHPIVRHGLSAIINHEADMQVVALAEDGDQAIAMFRQHQPDVALVDLRMPGKNGIEVIEALRKENRSAKIIILTTFDTDEDIYQGLRAGAMAYMLKGVAPDDLLNSIRTANEGQRNVAPDLANRVMNRMRLPELTARELVVLRLLVTGRSNKEIAAALGVGEGTVRTHCNSIFPKLGVSDRTQATTAALKRGLIRLDDVVA